MAWDEDAVKTLEAKQQQCRAQCQQLERQVCAALSDLKAFCTKVGQTQKANDRALEDLHRELGQLAAAANQQKLTALLIEPEGESEAADAAKGPAARKAVAERQPAAPPGDLRAAIEQARTRGNRFNTARIAAWLTELEEALRRGERAMVDRGLSGLAAEFPKCERSMND